MVEGGTPAPTPQDKAQSKKGKGKNNVKNLCNKFR